MENQERVERELLKQCGQVAALMECFAWLMRWAAQECCAKRPRLAVGRKQSIVARIAGGNEQSLVWREIDAAFENHVLTGVVINADYIELRRFLEDADNVVLEQVRDAVEKHSSIKVNIKASLKRMINVLIRA